VSDPTPTLSWSEPSGVQEYTLQIDDSPDFDSPVLTKSDLTTNSYTLTEAEALSDGVYYWRVRAYDAAGNASGLWGYFELTIDTQKPSAPTPLEPADGSATSITKPTFRWSEPEGVQTYTLIIDDDSDFSSPVQELTDLTDNSENLTTVLSDGTYYWRVKAIDSAGNESDWSSSFTLIIDTQEPPSPEPLGPVYGETVVTATPTLRWEESEAPENYTLVIDDSSDFDSPVLVKTGLTDNSYTLSPAERLENNVTYYWRVTAYDRAGHETMSSTGMFRTLFVAPPPPIEPEVEVPEEEKIPIIVWVVVGGVIALAVILIIRRLRAPPVEWEAEAPPLVERKEEEEEW
jgi:hypothetical protein